VHGGVAAASNALFLPRQKEAEMWIIGSDGGALNLAQMAAVVYDLVPVDGKHSIWALPADTVRVEGERVDKVLIEKCDTIDDCKIAIDEIVRDMCGYKAPGRKETE